MNHRVPPARDWEQARSARVIESHRVYLTLLARKWLTRESLAGMTASDLVQEALMAATVSQSCGQGPAQDAFDQDIRPWLATILDNKFYEAIRHQNAKKRGGGISCVPMPPNIPDEGTSPSRRAILNEEKVRLDEALSTLSADDLQLVIWSVKEGLSRREIGERLDVSATYASRICKRAEKCLRDAYHATRREEGSSL